MVLSLAVCEMVCNQKGSDVCDPWIHTVHVTGPPVHDHVCAEVTDDQKHGDGTVGAASDPADAHFQHQPQGCPGSWWQVHTCMASLGGTRMNEGLSVQEGRPPSRGSRAGTTMAAGELWLPPGVHSFSHCSLRAGPDPGTVHSRAEGTGTEPRLGSSTGEQLVGGPRSWRFPAGARAREVPGACRT